MGKLKFESNHTMKDIQILYDTTVVHANSENNFGLFCLGMAIGLRSVFSRLRKDAPFDRITQTTESLAITTVMLLDTFDDSKRDLIYAEEKNISNKKQSETIMRIAEIMRIERKRKERESE